MIPRNVVIETDASSLLCLARSQPSFPLHQQTDEAANFFVVFNTISFSSPRIGGECSLLLSLDTSLRRQASISLPLTILSQTKIELNISVFSIDLVQTVTTILNF